MADRPLSGFHFFGVSLRDFTLFGINSGISAFSGFQFGDPRLFGVSIRGFPPFRVFNSEIPAFSGFQFGDFRFSGFQFGDFRVALRGSPLGRFFLSVLGVLRTFRIISGFFFSGNQVHFGQVDPFRGFFSGKWVHFGASFRAFGSISVFLGAIGSILGISLRRLGLFFCFFKSLVPLRGFC